ncbi:MAG: hypothetical protein EBS98_10875 [Chitinophagia bacterium]|jgi:hypothetical protein|nr:hypothetical protein [Chitinophagia bacterium]
MSADGFRWFLGVVEDRDDPLQLGRVRIRVLTGADNTQNTQELPTANLPWAIPLLPIVSSSKNRVGLAPVGPEVGSTVFGFFMDGSAGQKRVYMGTMPGIPGNDIKLHDVPEQALGINNLNKQLEGPEPQPAFGAKYPYNKVFKSESGHVIEIDDTPSRERLHTYHRSGSYREIDAEGRRVEKVVGDDYEIVVKNKTVYIKGNVNIKVDGKYTVDAGGEITFKAPNINMVSK